MKSARFAFSVLVAAVLLVPASPTLAGNSAKRPTEPEMVDICHVARNGSAKLIHVSVNSSAAHARHGDGAPGSPVAGLDNFVYDDSCIPVETGPVAGCYGSEKFFDLKLEGKLGQKDNAAFWATNNGTCAHQEVSRISVVAADDADAAKQACANAGGRKRWSLAGGWFLPVSVAARLCLDLLSEPSPTTWVADVSIGDHVHRRDASNA